MLKFCSLYSGSSGNCLYVSSNNTKILIDCGTSCKKICEGLASINSSIEDIDAILVTHEHSDHVQGLGLVSKKFNIPVYANLETWNAMGKQKEKIDEKNVKTFTNDTDFSLNELTIHPFSTPHDASNPCGFNIHNGKRKLSIATDLGHIDSTIFSYLKNSSFIMLESNYDPEILKYSSYPYLLKKRIAGQNGHLSNNNAGQAISELFNYGLKNVMLGHLSKENNFPELAYKTVREELNQHNISEQDLSINIANRNCPSAFIKIC